jgi:hypothetical protein
MRPSCDTRVICRLGLGLVAGALALGVCLPPAHAQQAPAATAAERKARDDARKAFIAAQKAYEQGDHAAALESFRTANELIPSPQAEYWIAMSLVRQDRTEEAVAALETFLNNPGAEKIGDDKLADAMTTLEELKAKLVVEVSLATDPPGASVAVDGENQEGVTPMVLKLKPGEHKLSFTLPGHQPAELELDARGGEKLERTLALVPEPPPREAAPPKAAAPEPPAPAPPEPRSKTPAYITLGIAGAGTVLGTIFGIQALSAKSDFNENPTEAKADAAERNALFADISFGIALTVGLTGIVLLTNPEPPPSAQTASLEKPPTRTKVEVAPYVGAKSGGAFARFTF